MCILKRYYAVVLLAISFLMIGCGDDNIKKDRERGIDIIRYDKLVFGIDKDDVKGGFDSLKSKYPQMTEVFFKKVLDMPGYNSNDSVFFNELKTFITDSSMVDLYQLCQKEFGDMDDIEAEFAEAFARAKKLDSSIEIPRVYSYISGFVMQRFLFDDNNGVGIAFGLDMFLGDKFDYGRLERGQGTFSDYFARTYNKDHLVKKVLELWLDDIIGDTNGVRALDKMIKNGKKLYYIKKVMPEIEDTVLLNYSKEQLDWLGNNERELWAYMIKHNLFYTSNDYEVKRLIDFAPNSQALGMPRRSPGQTGVYIGYKIVDSYMRNHREKTIGDLIRNNDADKILAKSRFKPKIRE